MPDVSYFDNLPFRWSMTAVVSTVFACVRVVIPGGTAGRIAATSAASTATGTAATAAGIMRVRAAIVMVIPGRGAQALHGVVIIISITVFVIHAAGAVQFRTHVTGVARSFRAGFKTHTA